MISKYTLYCVVLSEIEEKNQWVAIGILTKKEFIKETNTFGIINVLSVAVTLTEWFQSFKRYPMEAQDHSMELNVGLNLIKMVI